MAYNKNRKRLLVVFILVLASTGLARTLQNPVDKAHAQYFNAVVGDGTPESCTEANFVVGLNQVLAAGDGEVSFNCGGPATINFTGRKYIDTNLLSIDGGGEITFNGGNITSFFDVTSGNLELRNITLANGYSPSHGGAIIAGKNTSVYLLNSTIENCRTDAGYGGGAILSFDTSTTYPSVEIEKSVILTNESGFGAINTVGKLVVRDSVIQGNKAINGGGAFSVGAGTEIYDSDIINNESDGSGGGLLIGKTASVLISGGQVWGNKGSLGGGIYNAGSLVLDNVEVDKNFAVNSSGGGLENYYGTAVIVGSTFFDNSSLYFGGAIGNDHGNLSIQNSTLSSNDSRLKSDNLGGGAISNYQGDVTINFATFVDNADVADEAIYNDKGSGSFNIKNTIITSRGGGINCAGNPLDSIYYSVIDDLSCLYDNGFAVHDDDPLVGILVDNGGPTLTHMIAANSPAVDKGDCSLNSDQRGVARPQGKFCDIGAVERRPNEGLSLAFLPFIR